MMRTIGLLMMVGVMVGFVGCGDDEDIPVAPETSANSTTEKNSPDSENTTVSDTSPFSTGGDITNAMALSRSGDCTTYANSYFSNVTDLTTGTNFSGDLTISVSGSKCIFSSNGIL